MLRTTALFILCLIAAVPAFAASYRWNGSTSELWSNPANWTPNGVPQSGDSLTFGNYCFPPIVLAAKASAVPVTINDLTPGLTFSLAAASDHEVRGNEIVATQISGVTAYSTCSGARLAIYAPLRLAGNASYFVSSVGPIDIGPYRLNLDVTGDIAGPLAGTGQLVLGGGVCGFLGCSATIHGAHTFTGVVSSTEYAGLYFQLGSGGATLPASSITLGRLSGSGTFGPVTVIQSLSGALNTGSLKLRPGARYQASTTTRVSVTGTVDIDQAVLELGDSFVAEKGQVFTLIDNDGTDPVVGTFKDRPEGVIFEQGARRFSVSYVGGDGNDVTLTMVRGAKRWQGGGGNNLWSNAANWVGGVPPVSGDSVQFGSSSPFAAISPAEVINDISGLVLEGLFAQGGNGCSSPGYSISGEPFGITADMGSAIVNTRVRAMADGVVLSGRFYGGIDVGSHSIEVRGPVAAATADQGITGTGNIAYLSSGCAFDIDGLHSFSGTVTLASTGAGTRFNGEMPATLQANGASVSAGGAIGNLSLSSGGSLTPSPFLDTRDLTLGAGASLVLSLADDLLDVTGTVTLSSPSLVVEEGPYVVGRPYVALRNDGTDAIVGTFAGVPEGGVIQLPSGRGLRVSYFGGDGNDLTLTPLAETRNDVDGDGKADIIWTDLRLQRVYRMSMDGLEIATAEPVSGASSPYSRMIGKGDFDGNGITDLLFYHPLYGTLNKVFFGRDGRVSGSDPFGIKLDATLRLAAVVDLDGDRRADLIWQARSGHGDVPLSVTLVDGGRTSYIEGSVEGYGRLVAAGRFGSGDLTFVFREEAGAGRVWFIDLAPSATSPWSLGTPRLVYQEADQAWRIVAAPDLNGDGVLDLLWRNSATGEIYGMVTAYSSGDYSPSQGSMHMPDTAAWVVADTGDYNGDGKEDILLYNEVDGTLHVMLIDGLVIKDQRTIYREPDTRWRPAGPWLFSSWPEPPAKALDMDGDGRSDVVYRNASTGQVYRFLADGLTLSSGAIATQLATTRDIVGDGDFDGDGHTDLLYRDTTNGAVMMTPFGYGGDVTGFTFLDSRLSLDWHIALVTDIDGDGRSDIVWRNPTTGQVYVMLMYGFTIREQGMVYEEADTNWKIVAAGDFTGGGMQNGLVWRNQATGQVYLQTVEFNGVGFPVSGNLIYTEPNLQWRILAAADFDGDGKADLLWRNDTTGQVWMMMMDGDTILSQGEVYTEPSSDWQIVAQGDYDGDGKADLLWRNSATGVAYMMLMDGRTIVQQGVVYSEPDTTWEIVGPGYYNTP